MPGSQSKARARTVNRHAHDDLKRTSRLEHRLRRADLLEAFEYIFILEELLCADGIGKDVCSEK